MQSHTGCIYLTCLHCVLSNVSWNYLCLRMHSHIGCTCSTFLHCVLSNVKNCQPKKRQSRIDWICVEFPTVCSQMSLQITWMTGCIFTLVALVQLFSTECFQMACMRRCKVTLAAFHWLYVCLFLKDFHISITFKSLFSFNFEHVAVHMHCLVVASNWDNLKDFGIRRANVESERGSCSRSWKFKDLLFYTIGLLNCII